MVSVKQKRLDEPSQGGDSHGLEKAENKERLQNDVL